MYCIFAFIWVIFEVNVDRYSWLIQYMEHMGIDRSIYPDSEHKQATQERHISSDRISVILVALILH